MTILLVENSELIIERLKDIISESGEQFELYHTANSDEALRLYDEIDPEVVIMDANLPANQSNFLFKKMKNTNGQALFIILCYKAVFMNFDCYTQRNADFLIDKFHEFEFIPSIITSIANSINPIQPK